MLSVDDIFELWRSGFNFGIMVTLLMAFVPAALSAVWNLLNMVDK